MEIIHADNDPDNFKQQLKFNDKTLDLPGCILYSRGGMIPHLTADNLTLINNNSPHKFANLPLSSIYEQPGADVMRKFSGTFHEFSSSQDTTWILNPADSHVPKPDVYKYNEEKCISIWAPSGRRKITPDEYMSVVETFSFDVAIAPSDCIPSGLTAKRCRKSQERTIRFIDRCLQVKEEKKLKAPLLGVVQGGDSLFYREKCAKELASRDVDGYVIGGLDVINTSSDWSTLLEVSVKNLGKDKVKFMLGVLTPLQVLQAVELGVDVFDTVIAYDAAERGCALNFPFKESHVTSSASEVIEESKSKKAKTDSTTKTTRDSSVVSEEESKSEKVRTNGGVGSDIDLIKPTKDLSVYEINLADKCYFEDDTCLFAGCACYTCTHHVRAYLHHLLVTKEMLAQVLLMIHNLTHWFGFFEEIRENKGKKQGEELIQDLINIVKGCQR